METQVEDSAGEGLVASIPVNFQAQARREYNARGPHRLVKEMCVGSAVNFQVQLRHPLCIVGYRERVEESRKENEENMCLITHIK